MTKPINRKLVALASAVALVPGLLTVGSQAHAEPTDPLTSYLFVNFTGLESSPDMEQIYFSTSQDGHFWQDLNDREPILTSEVGETGVRDPYIVRKRDDSGFFLIATDLSIYHRGGWGNTDATADGSHSIVVWESADLVDWGEPRLVDIAPEGAGMVWAPEAIWDEEAEAWMVYWTSKTPGGTGDHLKIYYAHTTDFQTFTEAQLYIDRGAGSTIIDTDIIKVEDTYFRASGDGQLTIEKSENGLHGDWERISDLQGLGFGLTGGDVEGPQFFKYNDDDAPLDDQGNPVDQWALLVDQYGSGAGYYPLVTTDIGDTRPITDPDSSWSRIPSTDYDFGMKKRHGSIIAITDAEYDALMAAYGPPEPPAPQQEPILHYDLTAFEGEQSVVDASGNGNDGEFHGTFTTEDDALTFSGDDWISLPDALMTDLDEITVAARIKTRTTGNHFIWGLGSTRTSDGIGWGYLFQNSNYRSTITPTNWTEETSATTSALPQDTWTDIALTIERQANGTYALTTWADGVARASVRTATLPRDIDTPAEGAVAANYIGKSLYNADQLFKGAISDFRIYNRALSASELAAPGSILGVELDSLKVPAIIDGAAGTVVLPVEPGTDLTGLDPDWVTAAGDVVSPTGAQDYTEPVTLTITGEGGTVREWTVTAVEMGSPVLPGLYADPNVAEFDGTYYIYATSDGYPGWGGQEFYVWKSDNLRDWTRSEQPFLTLDGDQGDVPWATGNAWAPTIIERDGKYYFYFSGHNPSVNRKTIGVAVADHPEGPFTAQPEAMILNNETVTSGQAIDPAAFHDPETGKYYLYWGNGRPVMAELADDMVSLEPGTIQQMSGLPDYREGTFVVYRDGTYHLTYSIDDTGSPDYRVGYATAPTAEGPWTSHGVILEKDPSMGILGTGHNSIIQVPGTDEWYIVYHRFAIPGGNGNNRETTIDHLRFGEDGLIEKVVPTLTSIEALEPSTEPSPEPSQDPSQDPSQEPPTAEPAPTVTVTVTSDPKVTWPHVPAGQDLYSTPGFHEVNGRRWHTICEPYSQTIRCRTEIWSGGGWAFNNLTYLPTMKRAQWSANPLGVAGEWTATDGRRWRTECDTAATGRNGCRSFTWSQGAGWVFNNIVRFKI